MRRPVSFLIGSLVIVVVFAVAYPLGGISAGGPLILAAVALAAGVAGARLVRPAAKDDLLLWVILLGVTVAVTYVYMRSVGTIGALPGSDGGPAR